MMIAPPPTGGIFLSWTTDQTENPDWISDSESESEDTVGTDQFWDKEDLFDNLSQEAIEVVQNKKDIKDYTEKSLKKKTTVSKKEGLDLVIKEKLSPVQAAYQLLRNVTGHNLENISEKCESKLLLQVDSLARKICSVCDHQIHFCNWLFPDQYPF